MGLRARGRLASSGTGQRTGAVLGSTRQGSRVLAVVVLALLAAAVPGGAPASAATVGTVPTLGNGSFAIAPTPLPGRTTPPDSFTVLAVPGQQFAESVSVANLTAAPLELLLYPADGYTIRDGGVFAVTGLKVATRDVGAWVSRVPGAVTIPARKQLNIPFTLRVPTNATPGAHAGGIVAQAAVPQQVQVNGTMKSLVYQQVFARVYVTVAGRLAPNFAIDSLQVTHPQPPVPLITHRSGSITYSLSNSGNAIIEPQVRIQVTGWSGTLMDRTVPATGQLLPGNIAQYHVTWPRVPSLGPVRVRLTVRSAYGLTRTADYSYLALPYPFLDVSGLLLLAAAVAIVLRVRRRRRQAAG